ncbi:unnamed protein product [Dicrocoelium dendriticum]|nr:unnamed protein product [Dicrocoelium dendriticum]
MVTLVSHLSVDNHPLHGASRKYGEESRYSGTSAASDRSIHQNPLGRIDPVLAAAAAAVLNAGFVNPPTSTDIVNLCSRTNSSSAASAVAAVAAAAMNAAAMAAALGVGNGLNPGNRSITEANKILNAATVASGIQRSSHVPCNRGAHSPVLTSRRCDVDTDRAFHGTVAHEKRNRDMASIHGRFPHHLDHRDPEDDPTATRTLFVGNLMPDITEDDLRVLFERYGFIEDIDIKRRDPDSGVNAYAFIRFVNLDMAHRAKVDMSGRLIGQFTCKIGYGKVVPTRCLWIGGLGPWITYPAFASLVGEFGPTEKIIWPSGKNYANILFPSVEIAVAAADALRGYPLGGDNRRIRVDFTDEAHMTRDPLKRQHLPGSTSSSTHFPAKELFRSRQSRDIVENPSDTSHPLSHCRSRKRVYGSDSEEHRNRTSSSLQKRPHNQPCDDSAPKRKTRQTLGNEEVVSSSKVSKSSRILSSNFPHSAKTSLTTVQSATNIEQLAACLPTAWNCAFFLKSSSFPCKIHILQGDRSLVDQFASYRSEKHSTPKMPNLDERKVTETDGFINLRITQRMRLDPVKLEDVSQRIHSAGNSGFCVLLAVPSPITSHSRSSIYADSSDITKQPQRPLRNLISYLRTKESAGVVLLTHSQSDLVSSTSAPDALQTAGVLHAFPPCDFAFDLLKERAVNLRREYNMDDHLVILLIRSTGTL